MTPGTIVAGRTKSGRAVQVLVVHERELESGIERRVWHAARLAQEQGCTHWRILSDAGSIVASGSAQQPMLTSEQAAAQSCPAGERSDW